MSYDGSSAKSYIRHATEKERLDNLAFTSFPEDYLPYASTSGHQRNAAPPPYLLWGDDRRRRPPKKRRKPKCAGALLCAIALVVVAILAVVAVSVYLGVVTNLFRSPVVSVSGRFSASEEFTEELLNSSSTKFLEKAELYQSKVEKAFLSSSLEPAFIAARVYSFRPGLVVFFRVYLDRRKIKQNDEESPPTDLVRELVAGKLAADPESVHIEENEELLAVELRPVEADHPPSLKKSPKSGVFPPTQKNGKRPPASGGVGLWRPIPIEDTVSPSFADKPSPGAGSVPSPEESSIKSPSKELVSTRIVEDKPERKPQLATTKQEGTGSFKVLEELPSRNPSLNSPEATGSVKLLDNPVRNTQPILQTSAGSASGTRKSEKRPLVPTDRIEGVGSVRLLPDSHVDTSPLSNYRQGTGSVRLAEIKPHASSKPLSSGEGTGSVHMLDDNPAKKLSPQENPSIIEGFIDPPTLAPSVMLVVRNRSRSDKPRNLFSRLEKGNQNIDLARNENVGISSVKEIIAESLPVPFKREPPLISSRFLDLNPEIPTESNLDEQNVTEVSKNTEEITSFNISTDASIKIKNFSQLFSKDDSKGITYNSVVDNTTPNALEVSEDTSINETQPQTSKTTLENILFSHHPLSSFETTETSENNFNEEKTTKNIIFKSTDIIATEIDKLEDITDDKKDITTEMITETTSNGSVFESTSSSTTNSDEDKLSSIVNYSQYLFTEPHFHTIEKETGATSEDSFNAHTHVGHGFYKQTNSSNDVAPSNLSLPDSTTEIPTELSMTTLEKIETADNFNSMIETTSFLELLNQSDPPIESSKHEIPELSTFYSTHVTNGNVKSDSETKVTETYDDAADSAEGIFSDVKIINATVNDTSQQAKVVPQMQSDLLSNDIEEETDEESNNFGNEILRHITTLRPHLNGSDSFLQPCPTGSVPCDITGESCGIRCDLRRDCPNNEDEMGCMCSDLLRAMGQSQKICDGIEDCSDKSDEANCSWCPSSDYFRCPGSRVCITMDRVCDGKDDCVGGHDERRCVNLAESSSEADSYDYRSEGYLIVRRRGQWGKLCLDALIRSPDLQQRIRDLGKAVCSALTYRNLSSSVHTQDNFETENSYYQIYTGLAQNKSSSVFEPTSCKRKEVLRVQCKTLECGVRPSAPPTQRRRIVGGRSAENAGSWPWAVALYREGDFQCGAALISDVWLVSAAHCFYSSQHAYWTARLGVLRRGSELQTGSEQVRKISNIILHPQYEDEGFINDIALLRLDQAVPFSDTLRPICLPSSVSEDASLWHGRRCSVVGWGKLYEIGHTFPDSLQEVRLPVISSSECQRRSIFLPAYRITPRMFCAGYDRGGRDACLGDSGGPMACQRPADGRWVLLGVTSNGDGCGRPGRPGVYSQVAGFLTWIQDVISDEKILEEEINLESMCSSGVRCRLGRCIPQSRICDGRRDCAEAEDEIGC